MQNTTEKIIEKMKEYSHILSSSNIETRNNALSFAIKKLISNKEEIFKANNSDIENARLAGISESIIKRLIFNDSKLNACIDSLNSLINLDDPIGKTSIKRELDSDLVLYRESCPIGVIGIIFEARPDALVQITGLCIKSGNCAVIKGGSEAQNTNIALFNTLIAAVEEAGIPKSCYSLLTSREEVNDILSCDKSIDLIIPRGSNNFVSYIMNNTKIPVMGHADGICHIYVDKECDTDMAINIIIDAKTQYCVACNAVETVLVHKDIAETFIPKLALSLSENNVTIKGFEDVCKLISCEEADESDFSTEYSDYILTLSVCNDVDDAIKHINKYGSHHTDAIISNNKENVEKFMNNVDSAGVYHNISTRFADGFRYGFGAEVGISTGKIHARGPVGLEGLCTYKYKIYGNGNIVKDYADKKRNFNFKDLI